MTVIFIAKDFWIEVLEIPAFSPPDGAGGHNAPLINLSKPGRFVGGGIYSRGSTASVTNAQEVAYIQMQNQGATNIDYGEAITGIIPRVVKGAGTGAAALEMIAVIYLRS